MSPIDESDRSMAAGDPVTIHDDRRTDNGVDSAAARLGADTMPERRAAGERGRMGEDDGRNEPLIAADRSAEYRSRWDAVKGQ